LDRSSVPAPPCLVAPDENGLQRRYGDLHAGEKEDIRRALLLMQRERCAYCERRTGVARNDGHIEHFRNQADHQALDRHWENLYWSCNDENTCGKHKDKCDRNAGPQARFDLENLIDPGAEDPERLLVFIVDGNVRPRDGLSPSDRRRAEETLRVFQLANSPFLRKMREDAIRPYVGALTTFQAFGPEMFVTYVRSSLAELDSAPFATAIKHYLESMIAP
jgi:uncharacterized protein (TIGR02646 family)